MTIPVDITLLEETKGPIVTLLPATTIRASGTGEAYSGFDGLDRLQLVVQARNLRGNTTRSLTVTVQQSEDGLIWTTAATHAFTTNDTYRVEIDAPADQLRVTWTAAGGLTSATVGPVTVTLGFVDETSYASLRDVDLGIVDFAEIFANGPTTLYEMQPGEFLKEIKFTDLDFEAIDSPPNPQDSSAEVYFGIGTIKSFQWYSFAQIARTSQQPATDAVDTVGLYINPNDPAFGAVYGPELGQSASKAMVLSAAAGGDIQAAIGVGSGDPEGFRVGAITGWQASTNYYDTFGTSPTANATPRLCAVLEDGTVWWNVGATDQSGLVEPDFPSRPLNGIEEGDILWSDSGLAATTAGKVHAVATISTPGS